MPRNNHRGKSLFSRLIDLLSGDRGDAFGRGDSFAGGKRRRSKFSAIGWPVAIILVVSTAVYLLSIYRVGGDKPENNSAKVLLEDESFDPLKQFDVVLETGNLRELETLLFKLGSQEYNAASIPVKHDINNKILTVAREILQHPDVTPNQRGQAARRSMEASWQLYALVQQEGINDPETFESLIEATEQNLEDEDPAVAHEAHLFKAQALIIEFLAKRLPGGFASVETAMINYLRCDPDDPMVITKLRTMFQRIREGDAEAAGRLAASLSRVADEIDTESARELARFVNDIQLLYDCGIGNLPVIKDISVDDQDFLDRLDRLLADPDTGTTVVIQLQNAILYFEDAGKFETAANLSQKVLDSAHRRTDPRAARNAEIIGKSGVQRNALIGKKWSFEEVDINERTLRDEQFADQVTLIFFCQVQSRNRRAELEALTRLSRAFQNRDLAIVLVEVDTAADGEVTSQIGATDPRWFQLASSWKQPNQYLQQCPIERFPYMILVGRDGTVDSIGLQFTSVKTRIEDLLARK